jgi:nucleotide-binding universal stress UspA family protein
MKILLAVDGSAFSDEAVREVARRPWPAGSEVRVVAAAAPLYAPYGLSAPYLAELEKEADDTAQSAIDRAMKLLGDRADQSPKVSTAKSAGTPAQVILREAEGWGADLIVLGSHGYGFWDRLLLGSVSQAVAAHAKCSVEIVRGRAGGEGEA